MISKMIFVAFFAICMAYLSNGQVIRKEFETIRSKPGMEGIIEECLKSSEIKVEELKDHKTIDDVSDKELGFYYCFYQGTGFVTEEGKINTDAVRALPAEDRQTAGISEEMIECLGKLDAIKVPGDMKILASCYF